MLASVENLTKANLKRKQAAVDETLSQVNARSLLSTNQPKEQMQRAKIALGFYIPTKHLDVPTR